MDQIVCLAFLETSIDTKIVSLSVFFFFRYETDEISCIL